MAVVEIESTVAVVEPSLSPKTENNTESFDNSISVKEMGVTDGVKDDSESNEDLEKLHKLLKDLKLNPLAKEFFPSSYNQTQMGAYTFVPFIKNMENDDFPNNRRRRNNYNQGRKRTSARAFRAQRFDSIRRTVYVSDIDNNITEEQLAALFSSYGQDDLILLNLILLIDAYEATVMCTSMLEAPRCKTVVDCRICGDPHSRLRFAFVEFSDDYSARTALCLNGTLLGFSPLKVLPSKTAILPVNPTFLPRSEDEREMCARTVYCTNIDKMLSQIDVKNFFEARCGEVSRLRLLGDQMHSTRIAFVEFFMAESAILALDCCGEMLGTQRIRVSPSKTPVRPQVPRPRMR